MAKKIQEIKIDIQKPVSVIVHSSNNLGFHLAKILIEQGSKVVLIDEFNLTSKEYITQLKKIGDVDFIDFRGYEEFFKLINRIDYLYFLQYDLFNTTIEFNSKRFLEESKRLDLSLKKCVEFKSKFILVNSIDLNKQLGLSINAEKQSVPTPYSNLELQKYSETLTAEYHDKSDANVRIARLGTILGENFSPSKNSTLHKLLLDSIKGPAINIYGEGLDTHFIINEKDALFGILKLVFAEETKGEVISLSNNNEYTTLSLAYKLLELNTNASDIKFIHQPESQGFGHIQYIPAPNAEKYGWKQTIPLEQTFIETMKKINPAVDLSSQLNEIQSIKENVNRDKPENKTIEVIKTPLGHIIDFFMKPFEIIGKFLRKGKENVTPPNLKYLALITIFFILLFYFILGPVISIGIATYQSYSKTKIVAEKIRSFEFESSLEELNEIKRYSDTSLSSLKRIEWVFNVFKQEDLYQNTYQILFAGKQISYGAEDSIDSLIPLSDYLKNFEPAIEINGSDVLTTREYRTELTQLKQNREKFIKSSNDILYGIQTIEGVNITVFPKFIQEYLTIIKDYSSTSKQIIEPLQKVIVMLPLVLGVDSRQTFLILFQNPSEIRSTGGWLSSYGIISFEGGQIRELKIDDVYNLDGDLKVQGKTYSPPESMIEALGISSWGFSLSNWEPDMNLSAKDMKFFIEESDKYSEIDGIISLDVSFIQKMLDIWGGIQIPDESEKITSANIYSKITEMHNEFEPGLSQKSTFLTSLSDQLVKKLLSSDINNLFEISDAVFTSLNEKSIIFYLFDQNNGTYFSNKGWSGIIDNRYYSSPALVEWNWGANKANLYLEKNFQLDIDINSSKSVEYSYKVTIKNNSNKNSYPEGDYENFVRIYLPYNASVTTIKGIDDISQKVDVTNNFKVISGWFNVPIKTTQTLEIKYILESTENTYFPLRSDSTQILLPLVVYKQPGAMNQDIKINITYPQEWILKDSSGFTNATNILSMQEDFNQDINKEISWSIK